MVSLKLAQESAASEAAAEDQTINPPTTAQKVLAAAYRLLMDSGYECVTLEKIAAEARVNKASIRYNYGNKAGLVAALSTSCCTRSSNETLPLLP